MLRYEIILIIVFTSLDSAYDGVKSHIGQLKFYPISIPLFGFQVSGVSVQRSRRDDQFDQKTDYSVAESDTRIC